MFEGLARGSQKNAARATAEAGARSRTGGRGAREREEASPEETEDTQPPKTREEHTQEVARWQRLKEY